MLTAFAAEGESSNPLIPHLPDLIWGTLAFIIIAFVVVRFVVPRFTQLLDDRAAAIEGGLKKAEEAQAAAQQAKDEFEAQLAEARAEAARIREQAREDAKSIRAELVEQAQADAARVTANAQAQIEAERAAALQSLRVEVGSLALCLASSVIGESLSDDKRSSALVDRFLADLETADAAAAEARK